MTTQTPAIRSQTRKIGKFVKIMTQTFLNCETLYDSTDAPTLIYDRKTAARPFDTIHDILRSLSLVKALIKDQNAPIGASGTEGLNCRSRSNAS